MIALKLTNTKNFMTKLLKSDCFDHFLLEEANIQTDLSFHIDGRLKKEFYEEEGVEELGLEQVEYIPFAMAKDRCLSLIKGKRTPLAFSFVFLLSPENQARTIQASGTAFTSEDISGMLMTIRFADGQLMLTTGISYRIFSMDKSLESVWDRMVGKFLSKNEIEFEIL